MMESITLFAIFIAIFLFGMTLMKMGLYHLASRQLKRFLTVATSHPLKGVLVGILVTGILQSSSAVLVLTISLVATSLLTFKQTIGLIIGANIGTTFTAELMAFHIDRFILPMLLVGACFMLFQHQKLFCTGTILFGLATIFVAMNGFESLAASLSLNTAFRTGLESANENHLLGVFMGTVITALIQSSTATTGIAMSLLNEQLITLATGTAIIFGANIGTCITGYLAAIGAKTDAKLTALAHIWLNVLGVILMYPFIQLLARVAETFTSEPDLQLAHVSVLFNVIAGLLALPFVTPFAHFISKLHGKRQ